MANKFIKENVVNDDNEFVDKKIYEDIVKDLPKLDINKIGLIEKNIDSYKDWLEIKNLLLRRTLDFEDLLYEGSLITDDKILAREVENYESTHIILKPNLEIYENNKFYPVRDSFIDDIFARAAKTMMVMVPTFNHLIPYVSTMTGEIIGNDGEPVVMEPSVHILALTRDKEALNVIETLYAVTLDETLLKLKSMFEQGAKGQSLQAAVENESVNVTSHKAIKK